MKATTGETMKMKIALVLVLLLLAIPASALSYEREPSVEIVSVGYLDPQKGITTPINSNYIGKGDKILVVTIYNPAVREKVEYSDINEFMFFNSREDMLFTAYNVEIELLGNENVKVKSGKITLPALPSMQTATLQFPVEIVGGNDVELKLIVKHEVIDKLRELSKFQVPSELKVPVEFTNTLTYNQTGVLTQITNSTRYRIDIPLEKYELEYVKKEKELPLKIFVEERDVSPEVKVVSADKLIAGGKGDIVVEIKNVGKKVARNAYAVVELPKQQQLQQQTTTMTAMTAMIPFAMTSLPSATTTTTAQPSYYIGDLAPKEVATAKFRVTLDVPTGGVYPVKLKLVYTDEYGNIKESDTATFGIEVLSKPKIEVKSVRSSVYVNSKGDVVVKLISNADMERVSARIVVSSPLSALSSECYIGDVRAGEEFTAVFRLKASSEAKETTYPADVFVKFKAGDDFVESDAVRIGVEVKPEVEFEAIGVPEIRAGEEKIVTFTIKNKGITEIRDATARIVIVSPFSSSDDSAFIGNLKPGEAVNASFKVSVDRDATPKLYALNLEVKYRAENGEWVVSKPVKAVIDVKARPIDYMIFTIVAIVVIAGIAYYVKRRK
ncbi:MAG: S-layer protein [Archaeoglobaceae archaeon]